MLARALLYSGIFLTVLGLIGLGHCVRKAMQVKRGDLPVEEADAALNRLVALNMASVGTAMFGLAFVVSGLLF